MDDIKLANGCYVLAVSGGVDSMSLLDVLSKLKNVKLIVAHFEHGIRPDSTIELSLVRNAANKYGLPFIYDLGNLGPEASEATSRDARYKFLDSVMGASGAKAIITAHHQDDKIETAIHNMMRGTGRKGLSSLSSNESLIRPLLDIPKESIIKYARDNKLTWREDITNHDTKIKRNYIRHKIIPRFSPKDRKQLVKVIDKTTDLNREIDDELSKYIESNSESGNLNRHAFIILPHRVALEVVAMWLRRAGIRDFNSKILERLTIAAKTLKAGQVADINHDFFLGIKKDYLTIESRGETV